MTEIFYFNPLVDEAKNEKVVFWSTCNSCAGILPKLDWEYLLFWNVDSNSFVSFFLSFLFVPHFQSIIYSLFVNCK